MTLTNDLRHALRSLRQQPIFAATAVLTLGLAVGANSAIFTIVNAALFSDYHVRASAELVNVYTTDSTGRRFGSSSYPDYVYLRDNARGFRGIVGYSGLMTTVTGVGQPEVLFGEIVTGNYFDVLGPRLALGRGFAPEEDRTPGTHAVVVIGHRLWQRRFGGDSAVLGRHITLNGHAFTIVGVAGREFRGLLFRGLSADLWAPVMMMGSLRADQLANRGERWMFVKARLAAGIGVARAQGELATLGAQLAAAHPATNAHRGFDAARTDDVLVSPEGDRMVLSAATLVLVLVGFVLVIACTNIANLFLARAVARQREVAVRLAIGASRWRIVRQLLTESAALAFFGGTVGLLLAIALARLLIAFRPPIPVPISLDLGVDWRVVTFTAALTCLACILFGLAPAVHASRTSLTALMSAQGPAPRAGRRMLRLRDAFLVPQLALSLVLLIVASLFVRSIGKADAVEPGFDMRHGALIALDLKLDGYDESRAAAFYGELRRRLRAAAGVEAVTVTDRIPLDLYGNQSTTISVRDARGMISETSVQYAAVDEQYFDALGVRLLRGRGFTEREAREGAPVVVLSEAAARRYWPNANPLGQRLRVADDGALAEVVGIAADVKVQTLGEDPQPFVYQAARPRYARLLRVVARGRDDPRTIARALRAEVTRLDPNVAVFEAKTLREHLDVMLFPYRIAAAVGSALGLFGLLLTSVGLYGVIAFSVARRTRELGIRLALGARPSDILRLVFGESGRVVVGGVVSGMLIALGVSRLLAGVIFGISSTDPATMFAVPLVLAAVVLVASWLPARRATRIEPQVALRDP